ASGLGVVTLSLGRVEGADLISREHILENNEARGNLSRVQESALIIDGAHVGKHVLQWGDSAAATDVLRQAPGPVLTVARKVEGRTLAGVLARIRPKLTSLERDSVTWQSERLAGLSLDFVLLNAVSGLLASFGLLQNSPAVVIGAMLVAPLLGPLTAISVGLVTAKLRLSRRASVTVLVGAAIAVVCGWLLGLAVPLESPTAEMAARGSPSLLDAGVALAAGAVGAYATARKEIPAALAGVAIAAALVPPLCTIGLGLAIGDLSLAFGATLLFFTNIVSVAVIGAGVFLWFGMWPDTEGIRQRRRAVSLGIVGVLTLITVIFVLDAVQDARVAVVAEQDLQGMFPAAEVVEVTYENADPIAVTATVRTSQPVTSAQVAAVERGLETRLGRAVDLSVVIEQVVRSDP
ncbi:MAG: TIGR00341 family protein, partial [Acidimicrobiia bacterium]|nr:TIGR00341 family protein [Acidimicrobiia bacterium]